MNLSTHNAKQQEFNAEATLRLIAQLPAPAGLEDRIHAGVLSSLAEELQQSGLRPKRRLLVRPSVRGFESDWLRSAAAAAIVSVVVGGGWAVLAGMPQSQATRALPVPPRVTVQGGFSNAGAMRTPQNLNGPILVPKAGQQALPANGISKPSPSAKLQRKHSGVGEKALVPLDAPAAK